MPLDRNLDVRVVPILATPRTCRGPSAGERIVTVDFTIPADHPFVSGRLVDPDGHPVADTVCSVFCRSASRAPFAAGSVRTDAQGHFAAHLSDACRGLVDAELSFGMAWEGLAPTREVSARVPAALRGSIDLGAIVMPKAR